MQQGQTDNTDSPTKKAEPGKIFNRYDTFDLMFCKSDKWLKVSPLSFHPKLTGDEVTLLYILHLTE